MIDGWSNGYILDKDFYTRHEVCGIMLIFSPWVTDVEMNKFVKEHEKECSNEERV